MQNAIWYLFAFAFVFDYLKLKIDFKSDSDQIQGKRILEKDQQPIPQKETRQNHIPTMNQNKKV